MGGLTGQVRFRAQVLHTSFYSLFYNEFLCVSYVFDTIMEPALWFVDTFAKILGPLFVVGVLLLMSSVIAIAYLIGLPFYLQYKDTWVTVTLVGFGHYLLINIVFNYWMALTTAPGSVPHQILSQLTASGQQSVASLCKKCLAPKPPRTHHCSVCQMCVLKMDHHCPWLNQCVGHFNHRYFFLYMSYLVLGCLFIMAFGFEIFLEELLAPGPEEESWWLFSRRTLILYEAFITTGTVVILGGLTAWHARLISRGETSIEAHINRSEARRLGTAFRNPYDLTPYYNWCLFLGLIEGRGLASVLWPSRHRPKGDGLHWDTVYSCDIRWSS